MLYSPQREVRRGEGSWMAFAKTHRALTLTAEERERLSTLTSRARRAGSPSVSSSNASRTGVRTTKRHRQPERPSTRRGWMACRPSGNARDFERERWNAHVHRAHNDAGAW